MKIEIQKNKIEQLDKLYNDLSESIPTKKMKLVCHRNKLYIKDELEAIKKASEPSEEFKEYEKKRMEIIQPYMVLGDDGNPLTENVNGILTVKIKQDKSEEVNKSLEEHNEKHKEIIEKQQKDSEEWMNLLQEKVEIEVIKIKFKDLPEMLDGDYDSNLLFEYLVDFDSEIEE